MSIVDNKVLDPKLVANVDADLQPTKKRIMGSVSYAASFMGGCVSIGTFSMGAALIGTLTVAQAIIAMCIGCLVIAVALAIIGECGHEYGIPFTVQLRSSFGTTGVKDSRSSPWTSGYRMVWLSELDRSRSYQQLSEDFIWI